MVSNKFIIKSLQLIKNARGCNKSSIKWISRVRSNLAPFMIVCKIVKTKNYCVNFYYLEMSLNNLSLGSHFSMMFLSSHCTRVRNNRFLPSVRTVLIISCFWRSICRSVSNLSVLFCNIWEEYIKQVSPLIKRGTVTTMTVLFVFLALDYYVFFMKNKNQPFEL